MGKGVAPKVSVLVGYGKTRPIQHGEGDNTELIEQQAQSVHAKRNPIQGPKNMPYGTGNARAASDEGKAFNGNTVTAPPQSG